MKRKISGIWRGLLVVLLLLSLTASLTVPAQAASEEDIQAAIDAGIAWLVSQQNPDGSWGDYYPVGVTAFGGLICLPGCLPGVRTAPVVPDSVTW